jgi:uncharacterized protein YraI
MRRLLRQLAIISIAIPAVVQSQTTSDTIAYATATIRIRERPSAQSKAVAIVAQGTRLRLYQCSEGWCGVSVQKTAGYALEEYLSKQVQAAAAPQGGGYVNSRGNWVPSPTRTADGQPPAGATAKCGDGTFSFSQSRRGTCSHHGGVAEWL